MNLHNDFVFHVLQKIDRIKLNRPNINLVLEESGLVAVFKKKLLI